MQLLSKWWTASGGYPCPKLPPLTLLISYNTTVILTSHVITALLEFCHTHPLPPLPYVVHYQAPPPKQYTGAVLASELQAVIGTTPKL